MRTLRNQRSLPIIFMALSATLFLANSAVAVEPNTEEFEESVKRQVGSIPDPSTDSEDYQSDVEREREHADDSLGDESSETNEDGEAAGDSSEDVPMEAPPAPSPPGGEVPDAPAPDPTLPETPEGPGNLPSESPEKLWKLDAAPSTGSSLPAPETRTCSTERTYPVGNVPRDAPSLPTEVLKSNPATSPTSEECADDAAPWQPVLDGANPQVQASSVRYSTTPLVGEMAAIGIAAVLVRLLWLGFSRLQPEDVLTHPRRSQIMDFIRNEPGVTTHAAAKSLGLRWSVLVYHLGQLQRTRHVTISRVGGRTALFPANTGFRGKEQHVALLRRDTLRRVHELLSARPGLDQGTIASDLQVSQALVSRSLQRLGGVGLVRQERKSRKNYYFPVAVPT